MKIKLNARGNFHELTLDNYKSHLFDMLQVKELEAREAKMIHDYVTAGLDVFVACNEFSLEIVNEPVNGDQNISSASRV